MTKEELLRRIEKTVGLGKATKSDAVRDIQRKWYLHYKKLLRKLESAPGISKPTLDL